MSEALAKWRERQAKKCTTKAQLVFTTKDGARLHHSYVRRKVNCYAKKASIDKHITLHTFRHTLATDLYKDTSRIRLVQKELGQPDLATTAVFRAERIGNLGSQCSAGRILR